MSGWRIDEGRTEKILEDVAGKIEELDTAIDWINTVLESASTAIERNSRYSNGLSQQEFDGVMKEKLKTEAAKSRDGINGTHVAVTEGYWVFKNAPEDMKASTNAQVGIINNRTRPPGV